MGLIESIPGLQTVIDFIGGLYDTLMGKYPKDEVITEVQQKQKDAKQQLEELFARK
jgi:predicted translin family RNA/ssDNA-binding protein